MNAKGGLSATTMRVVLLLLFIVSLAGFVALYYFGNSFLSTKASELNNALTNSYSSSNGASIDSKSKAIISGSATLLTKIDSVYASNENYQQTTSEAVRSFANKANFQLDNISYDVSSTKANAKAFEIKTNGPVDYSSLITLIMYIEKSLPKMQITKIDISADKANPSKVVVNNLTVEVYIK